MTAEELTSEFQARGFDYLSSTRALGYINDAYLVDICEVEDWPFLEAETSGAAPLTISDLRSIDYVANSVSQSSLRGRTASTINDSSWNLSEAGTPCYYYVSNGVLKVFPVSTESLVVRYYKTPPRLSGSSSPLLPERFHSLILDGAVARAYEDSDDWELAQSAEGKFQMRLQKMRESLLDTFRDGPTQFIEITDPYALS